MQLRMWTYDLAREQCPTLDFMRRLCRLSLDSGYNALGLYMEHRFAFDCTPWAHGAGCLTPDIVRTIQREFSDLQIVPFLNVLGHCEGFNRTEVGRRFAEETVKGMQACPTNPDFKRLSEQMVDEALALFTSPLIHIGGDEAQKLGTCARCAARIAELEENDGVDGKAHLYGIHVGHLAHRVLQAGKTPAVWGDMLEDHPQAMDHLPKETVVFVWKYFSGPTGADEVARRFKVVYCPSLHTYNAAWLHLPQSERNLRLHIAAVEDAASASSERPEVLGVCLTTWECGLMGNYETLFPGIQAAGKLMRSGVAMPEATPPYLKVGDPVTAMSWSETFLDAYGVHSASHREWARLMGVELQFLGGVFVFSGQRRSLKCRLLLFGNPFLAWRYHAAELAGPAGDQALQIAAKAIEVAPDASYRGVSTFIQKAVEFVRFAEQARQAYEQELPGVAASCLAPCRQIFDELEKVARATHLNACGSLADVGRCKGAKEHVERVIRRIKEYGDRSMGYLPAFEVLTDLKFVPHDQGAWWLVNDWANE